MPAKRRTAGGGSGIGGSDRTDGRGVPDVRPTKRPVAICISDTHFGPVVPAARGESPVEWCRFQIAYAESLTLLQRELGGVPIVHAGDVFDKWNTPVEFVNLLVENWPTANFFAVPGQHDLPNHNYADIRRSAYWNMVKSGRITTLDPGKLQCIGDGLYVRGFPWGVPVEPMTGAKRDGYCYLSVAHRYVWAGDAKYKDAEVGDCAERPEFGERYRGYDAVVWGDNHKPWSLDVLWHPNKSPTTYFNHGTALRRHADERGLVDMGPGVFGPGVLYDDGSIVRVELDGMPPEVWADAPAKSLAAPLGVDADRLLALLRAGGEAAVSFRDAVDHAKRTAAPPLTPDETAVLDGWLHAAGVLR